MWSGSSPSAGADSVEAVAQHARLKRDHTDIHVIDRLVLDPAVPALRELAKIARKMHVGHVNAHVLLAMLFVLVIGAGIF